MTNDPLERTCDSGERVRRLAANLAQKSDNHNHVQRLMFPVAGCSRSPAELERPSKPFVRRDAHVPRLAWMAMPIAAMTPLRH